MALPNEARPLPFEMPTPESTPSFVPIKRHIEASKADLTDQFAREVAMENAVTREISGTCWGQNHFTHNLKPLHQVSNKALTTRKAMSDRTKGKIARNLQVAAPKLVFSCPPGVMKGVKRKHFRAFADSAKEEMKIKTKMRKMTHVEVSDIDITPYVKRAELKSAEIGLKASDPFNKVCLHPQLEKFVGKHKNNPKNLVDIRNFKRDKAKEWGVDDIDNVRLFQDRNPQNVCFSCGAKEHPQRLCKQATVTGDQVSSEAPFVKELLDFINEEYTAPTRPKSFRKSGKDHWTIKQVKAFEAWVKSHAQEFWSQFRQIYGRENEFQHFPEFSLWRKRIARWAVLKFPKRILTRIVNGWGLGWTEEPPHIAFTDYEQSEELQTAKTELIKKLIEKGALLRCPEGYPEVIIPTFAIDEGDKFRLIWDGTPVNPYCIRESPQYPDINEIMSKSPEGTYITRDWKSAFQQVPLRFDEMRKVGIQFQEGNGMSYAIFASPPFGATGAPDIHWTAQCAVQDKYNSFHAFPHAMMSYADDSRILLSPSGHPQEGHLEASILFSQVFHELLGIRLSQKATTNPANEVAFLGQDMNFKLNQTFPNLEKLEKFCEFLKQLSDKKEVTIREIAQTRGKYESLSNFLGHFLTLSLNHITRKYSLNPKIWVDKKALKQIWDKKIRVTSNLLETWAEWLTFLHVQSLQVNQKISGDDILIVSDAGPKDFAYFVVPHT